MTRQFYKVTGKGDIDVMSPITLNDDQDMSDGDHTFAELYAHRRALTAVIAAYAATQQGAAWRSKNHHPDDSPMFDGYFIVGIDLDTGPISYHYELEYWDDFDGIPEVTSAPKWDGHTADDVVTRLKQQAQEIVAWRTAR